MSRKQLTIAAVTLVLLLVVFGGRLAGWIEHWLLVLHGHR